LPNENVLFDKRIGLDVKTGLEVDLLDAGIVDSYASIESAIKNASSIACSYLRAYILINKNIKEGN
jgi:chaperonin GroEL (HSP60 family)